MIGRLYCHVGMLVSPLSRIYLYIELDILGLVLQFLKIAPVFYFDYCRTPAAQLS